ncbi:MAG TPA: hypothetical protein VNA20_18910 [Frankiaceae bacterium]|nr:hypothetical protein [Frankiaceae bacterium]
MLGAVLALVAGVAWWTYPGNRLDRQFRGVDVPESFQLVRERSDVVPWFPECFDHCSLKARYYTTSVPAREAADALHAALRAAGYEITWSGPCGPPGRPPAERECFWSTTGTKSGYIASARVPPPGSGPTRAQLMISVSG